ncbi:multiple inositol polyphosphate phosphatase 1-like [Synchiropus splendidus]|uniref:multiple inositol polyphosphate phosphatase 1-like n=1 Tax=Synchiropus splendidus TaxID=270530 RepID=UPI00237DABDE|nr:multiple inositol polyphosphate phosphatase 1-like [Synchiropus splendidus]
MTTFLRTLLFVYFTAAVYSFFCFRHEACHFDDFNIPKIAAHFSTKGRYEEVNAYLLKDILAVNRSVLQPPFAQCREIYMAAVIRHGTRYPTTKNVQKIQKIYELVKSSATGKESWLREIQTQWKMWYTEDMDGRLVQKGVDDHKHLAVRLSKWFPSLLSEENLRAGRVKFITSSKHRCVNSTLSFQAGLVELWDVKDMTLDYTLNDALMRFFDKCPRFVEEVDNNPEAVAEVEKFKNGPEMRRVMEKIADRLNVPYNNITDDMAEAAFYICAYELAIKNLNSPWCALIDEVDAEVIEYANDLKHFWKRGYGHEINSKSSCILFHDIFSRLDKAVNDSKLSGHTTEAVTIQVGHAETVLPLLTLLGFFKDKNILKSTNYATERERTFRTSFMLPYAANLVFVLYDCGGRDLRMQAMLNERPIPFPGMADSQTSMPRYQDVKEHYSALIQGCDFDKECML